MLGIRVFVPVVCSARKRLAIALSIPIALTGLVPAQAQNTDASEMFTVTPCRLYDSRIAGGPMVSGFDRVVDVANHCGISADATAITANLTAVTPSNTGTMKAYPGPSPGPTSNVVAFRAGVTRAASMVVGLSPSGQIRLWADIVGGFSGTTHVVLDVSAYFRTISIAPVWQWRPWEQTLLSGTNYAAGGANPYRDMIVGVRFTRQSDGLNFLHDAFWRGTNQPLEFTVRAAFPPGVWNWQLESCSRNTTNCLGDSWSPRSGSVTVYSHTQSGRRIWDRGHLQQLANVTPLGTTKSPLLYADLTPFYWAGDTAWAAPPREISGQRSAWASYLADRRAKGFTTVLLAPAASWQNTPGQDPLPDVSGFSFDQVGSCGSIIPNDCSFPRPAYWDQFDAMVRDANIQDLVAVIAGVLDPAVEAAGGQPTNDYPNLENAKDFARYLAARMGGYAALFSPGFDDPPDGRTQDGVHSMDQILNGVGLTLQATSPGVPLTNHLGGRRTCTDYASFRNTGWMDFYMFHRVSTITARSALGQRLSGRVASRRARRQPEWSLRPSPESRWPPGGRRAVGGTIGSVQSQ